MKRMFFAVALVTVFFAVGAYAQSGSGNTTRYWDSCKPSCGWTSNASGSPSGTCKSCNVSGAVLSNDGEQSACNGGGAYTCMKQVPWKVSDNLSYGFAANNAVGCGKCVELTFTGAPLSGKKMIVMASNIGDLTGAAHFDLMIPGGGVGLNNALTKQLQQNGVSNPNLGAERGGFRTTCGNNKDCVRRMCNDAFGTAALADMKAGCEWYVDWFEIADNPNVNYTVVTCPQELIDKYKGNFSANPNPPAGNTYTLTTSANPAAGGNVTRNPAGPNYNAGTQVTVTAQANSGYTFTRWEGASTSTNASVTVTMNSNQTLTAVFTQQGSNPTPTGCNPTGRRDTIKVEAESFTSKVGDGIKTDEGMIGYIENGNSVTYNNVNAGKAGSAILQFRLATEVNSSFTVEVNGANAGTITQGSTGGWSNFQMVSLGSCATLRAGANTIKLNFQSAVNIDNFLLIGDIKNNVSSVRPGAAEAAFGRSAVTLKAGVNGFSALLPAGHGFTSYSVIDLQGREIRSGRIGISATDLSVGGLKRGVVFLRLEGKDQASLSLKVVTYR